MFLARSPMRCRSLETRSAAKTSRKSTAIGWRRAMVRTAFSSISCCNASMVGSAATTRIARLASRRVSAWIASAISRSARPPISATLRVSSCRSPSNALAVCSFKFIMSVQSPPSAEAAGDVILGAPVVRRGEHPAGGVELDQLTEIHKGGEIRDPRGLLHVVGDDHEGVFRLQLVHQLFDLGGRDRIERRARLVEQDHLGAHRDGARDAQALLLAAGQAQAVGAELALDLVPKRGALERCFHAVVELALRQLLVEPDAEGDVLVNRHRKRRRLL